MDPRKTCLVLTLAAGLGAACLREVQETRPIAIVGGRVFDATGSAVVEDGVVVIVGERIVAVGSSSEVEIPGDARRIDAGGGFVMPGVIDNHVHVLGPLLEGEDVLTPWLEAGVTTLVDVGTQRGGVRELRELAARISEESPRLFVAGPILTAPGGYPMTRPEPGVELVARELPSVDAAREAIADLIDVQGADVIKVAVEAGFGVDVGDAEAWPLPELEIVAAIVEEAHARGRLVRAHVTDAGELERALDAGVDALAHTPITVVPRSMLERSEEAGVITISTANIWGHRGTTPGVVANLATYHDLGGRIALGTDYPYQQGSVMPLEEMAWLEEAGLSPEEVLIASTRNGALALGRADELGTLEAGKLADVIVVAGDPLVDLVSLRDVRVVIRGGEVVRE